MTSPASLITNLRPILAYAPTSICAVAALVNGRPTGMAVGSFVGLSLDPPLVGLSISRTSATWELLRLADDIGISVLTQEHAPIVRQLAGPPDSRFRGVGWSVSGDAVHLESSAVHLRVKLIDEVLTGDHIFAVLEVLDAEAFSAEAPLIFHGSQVTTVVR